MLRKLTLLNTGAWPKEVWYAEVMVQHWAERWTVHRIQCYAEGWKLLGEWPRWALTPAQEKQIDEASFQLLHKPHP